MIQLEVDVFYLLYLGAGFVLIFGMWFYSDHKDKLRILPRQSKVVYHCIKCSQIYTGAHGSEEIRCPRCGFINSRLRY